MRRSQRRQNGKIAYSDGSSAAIWTMNPDGTGQTRLRDGFEPNWSADGTKLVFAREHDIRIMPADGSTESVVLSAPGTTPEGGFRAWHTPAWSPDGTQIVTGLTDWFETISTAWADGSGVVQQDIAYGASPAWSPTGADIAYVSRPAENPTAQGIYAVHPDGTGMRTVWEQQRQFGPWPTSDPDYSPDGSKIIFSTLYPGNDYQIWVVPAAGGTPVRLTNNASADVDAVWSPDGQKIAFASDRDGNFEIYTMNADGTNQTRITNDPAPQRRPNVATGPRIELRQAQGRDAAAGADGAHLSPRARCRPDSTARRWRSRRARRFPSPLSLTIGTPDANGAQPNMEAHVRYVTVTGDPTTPADEADIEIRTKINDVRVLGTNADYTGEVEAQAIVRVTDRNNSATDQATTTDFPLPLTVQCVPTASTSIGSDLLRSRRRSTR